MPSLVLRGSSGLVRSSDKVAVAVGPLLHIDPAPASPIVPICGHRSRKQRRLELVCHAGKAIQRRLSPESISGRRTATEPPHSTGSAKMHQPGKPGIAKKN